MEVQRRGEGQFGPLCASVRGSRQRVSHSRQFRAQKIESLEGRGHAVGALPRRILSRYVLSFCNFHQHTGRYEGSVYVRTLFRQQSRLNGVYITRVQRRRAGYFNDKQARESHALVERVTRFLGYFRRWLADLVKRATFVIGGLESNDD